MIVIVDISDDPITSLNRKAYNHAMVVNRAEKYVSLSGEVRYFKDGVDAGISKGFDLKATNDVLVDPSTGVVIDEEFQGSPMGEFDYYMYIAENVEVKVNDMTRMAMLTADESGKFNA